MASMDIFNSSAFSTMSLTGAVEKIDYKPSFLGSLGVFDPMPVRTKDMFVERRDGVLTLIPTSATGAPPEEQAKDSRDVVNLTATRLAKGFTLNAVELQNIRAYGSETELMAVQSEFIRRMGRVRDDMELTHEFHRLGALQGMLLDADGVTVIYDYFTHFNEAAAATVSFELDVTTTDVRQVCHGVTRSMARSARGAFTPTTTVHALCGDDFYDSLIQHGSVEKTYANWAAAADLRENIAFESFPFAGITFHNYRGTDDNATVAIAPNEAKLFPIGARDVFKKAMAPHETMEFVNTPGRDVYAMTIRDRDRNMWVRGELYSYPLYFCQQPRVLRSATLT